MDLDTARKVAADWRDAGDFVVEGSAEDALVVLADALDRIDHVLGQDMNLGTPWWCMRNTVRDARDGTGPA